MKFFPIVWRNLLRRKFRTFFTIGAIFFAFLLFGVLMAIRAAFSHGRGHGRPGTADGDRQGVDHQPAARVLRGADQADRRA